MPFHLYNAEKKSKSWLQQSRETYFLAALRYRETDPKHICVDKNLGVGWLTPQCEPANTPVKMYSIPT